MREHFDLWATLEQHNRQAKQAEKEKKGSDLTHLNMNTMLVLFDEEHNLVPEILRIPIKLIKTGKVTQLKALMKEERTLSVYKDNLGNTLFHYAAYYGNTEIIKLLLALRAGIYNKNKLNITPLHIAAFFGHTHVVEQLIEYGAPHDGIKIKVENFEFSCTPLHMAILNKKIATASCLLTHLQQRGNINDTTVFQLGNIYHLLALVRDTETITHFMSHEWLAAGRQFNKTNDKQDFTPMSLAAYIGNVEAIYCFAKIKNIEINFRSYRGNHTPLNVAIESPHANLKTVLALLEIGAAINSKNANDLTAIQIAEKSAREGSIECKKIYFLLAEKMGLDVSNVSFEEADAPVKIEHNDSDEEDEKAYLC